MSGMSHVSRRAVLMGLTGCAQQPGVGGGQKREGEDERR